MITYPNYKSLPVVLFCNVPVGALIAFNGFECEKLDASHVRFIRDLESGEAVDYSKPYNARYARSTESHIGGHPVRVLETRDTLHAHLVNGTVFPVSVARSSAWRMEDDAAHPFSHHNFYSPDSD
jgi:hypothetical protein